MSNNNGIQLWTVPKTGYYRFICAGARGGNTLNGNFMGGAGVILVDDIFLYKNEIIKILIGQKGLDGQNVGSGGGATFIIRNDNSPILIAGGGSGSFNNNSFYGSGLNAVFNQFPFDPYGWIKYNSNYIFINNNWSSGSGAGFVNNGSAALSEQNITGGFSFLNGGTGGSKWSQLGFTGGLDGGFGGGGGYGGWFGYSAG